VLRWLNLLAACAVVACATAATSVHAELLAFYNLNGITNAQISALQYQTNNQLVFGAELTDWTKSGFNAVHAIQLSGTTPGGPGNYAIMIFGDNLITQQTAFAANDSGKTYYASYDIGPTVYATPSEATQAGDQSRINLLRGDNSISPRAWWRRGMARRPDVFAAVFLVRGRRFRPDPSADAQRAARQRPVLRRGRQHGLLGHRPGARTLILVPGNRRPGRRRLFDAAAMEVVTGRLPRPNIFL